MPAFKFHLNGQRLITSCYQTLCPTPFVLGLALLVCAPLVGELVSQANPSEDYAEGIRLFAKKDYAGASKALEASFDAEPAQRTLFAWGQAERLQGNCEASGKLFSQYIANGANKKQSRAAYELMSDCVERQATPKDIPNDSPPETTDTTKVPGALDGSDPGTTVENDGGNNDALVADIDRNRKGSDISSPWYKDWVGMSLLGSGGVGLIVGGAAFVDALRIESNANTGNIGNFGDAKADATNRRKLAVGATIAGGALVTGALVYYYFTGGDSDKESNGLSLNLDGTSTGFSYGGSF